MNGPTLFDAPATAGRARVTDPDTSREAARSVNAAGIRGQILRCFLERPRWCDADLCLRLSHLKAGSVVTARSGLKFDGLVEASGAFRVNRHHRRQIVWQLTEQGREKARALSERVS